MSWKKPRLAANCCSTWWRIRVATRLSGRYWPCSSAASASSETPAAGLTKAAASLAADPNWARAAVWLMIIGLANAWPPMPWKPRPDLRIPAIVFRSAVPVRGSVRVKVSPGL